MFNFTTQTVYNSIVEATVAQKGDRVPKNANLILNTIQDTNPTLRIGNTRFVLADIIDIQVKNPSLESLTSVTFDVTDLVDKVTGDDAPNEITARVALWLGLSMASQDSYYANALLYKGKPLYVEFPVKKGDDAETVANRVKNIANKFFLLQTEEKILDITVDDAEVTFTGVNGYQQIRKAALQWYNPESKSIDCCANEGAFEDLYVGVPVIYTIDGETGLATAGETAQKLDEDGTPTDLADNEVAILPGLEAFGDYNWIIHNLRLPTAANTGFWSPTRGEMPVVGQQYTQFIIRMKKERDNIMGEIVGARGTSVTTHVIYAAGLASDATSPAGKVNKALFTDLGATSVKLTDADDKLEAPFE